MRAPQFVGGPDLEMEAPVRRLGLSESDPKRERMHSFRERESS
jgi:hypothetical protein